jgi:hypothetical protein
MLVGNVGLALAALALQDLQQYPFKEGRRHLASWERFPAESQRDPRGVSQTLVMGSVAQWRRDPDARRSVAGPSECALAGCMVGVPPPRPGGPTSVAGEERRMNTISRMSLT